MAPTARKLSPSPSDRSPAAPKAPVPASSADPEQSVEVRLHRRRQPVVVSARTTPNLDEAAPLPHGRRPMPTLLGLDHRERFDTLVDTGERSLQAMVHQVDASEIHEADPSTLEGDRAIDAVRLLDDELDLDVVYDPTPVPPTVLEEDLAEYLDFISGEAVDTRDVAPESSIRRRPVTLFDGLDDALAEQYRIEAARILREGTFDSDD